MPKSLLAAGLIALVVLMLGAGSAHGAKKILSLVEHPFSTGMVEDATMAAARRAIISGATSRGWKVKDHDDSSMIASIWVRNKHFAEVKISYTPTNYSITYMSSENLDYRPRKGKIHRQYNNWVLNLSRSIDYAYQEAN